MIGLVIRMCDGVKETRGKGKRDEIQTEGLIDNIEILVKVELGIDGSAACNRSAGVEGINLSEPSGERSGVAASKRDDLRVLCSLCRVLEVGKEESNVRKAEIKQFCQLDSVVL